MQRLHQKAVILQSYEGIELLDKSLCDTLHASLPLATFDRKWFDERPFDLVIFFNYYDKLYWSWGRGISEDSKYSLLPLHVIINPSDYPEYFI